MKFENPIMNISMFEVENVVTQASGGSAPQDPASAADAVTAFIAENNAGGITITF